MSRGGCPQGVSWECVQGVCAGGILGLCPGGLAWRVCAGCGCVSWGLGGVSQGKEGVSWGLSPEECVLRMCLGCVSWGDSGMCPVGCVWGVPGACPGDVPGSALGVFPRGCPGWGVCAGRVGLMWLRLIYLIPSVYEQWCPVLCTVASTQKMAFLFLRFGGVHGCNLILVSVCNTLTLPVRSSLVAAIATIHFNQKSEIFTDTELQEAALSLWLDVGRYFNVSAAFSKGNVSRCFY